MDRNSYKVSLKWGGGSKGVIESGQISIKIEVAIPFEFEKGTLGIYHNL